MAETRVAVNGAGGEMGGQVFAAAAERDDIEAVLGVAPEPEAAAAQVPVVEPEDLGGALDRHAPDALVDFSVPAAAAAAGPLEPALAALPEYDVELLETHHSRKREAPSGTAETILETVADHRELDRVPGREGTHDRTDEKVGVLVRRAGTIRGEHELLLADNDEVLTLTHRAEDRGVFAAGALDAAVWIAGRPPGSYAFTDVVAD
ncbi:4-hydroxy-tetrahydrodipicolinate reductase [Halobacteriales archaeon QH_10_67_13]|nr:MAG: 4-hydroxy-tetrahydrodipicolinate reductase [Halobacteriales archaeon QH_10_67_13]